MDRMCGSVKLTAAGKIFGLNSTSPENTEGPKREPGNYAAERFLVQLRKVFFQAKSEFDASHKKLTVVKRKDYITGLNGVQPEYVT